MVTNTDKWVVNFKTNFSIARVSKILCAFLCLLKESGDMALEKLAQISQQNLHDGVPPFNAGKPNVNTDILEIFVEDTKGK